jgi:hypothetical protein
LIDLDALVTWLAAVPTATGAPVVKGPRQLEFGNADELVMVDALGGLGMTLEGAGDQPGFRLKLVAREFREAQLRQTAFQLDTALVFGDYPDDLWGTRIQYVERSAGPPELLPEDELDRVSYVCTYIAHETPEM